MKPLAQCSPVIMDLPNHEKRSYSSFIAQPWFSITVTRAGRIEHLSTLVRLHHPISPIRTLSLCAPHVSHCMLPYCPALVLTLLAAWNSYKEAISDSPTTGTNPESAHRCSRHPKIRGCLCQVPTNLCPSSPAPYVSSGNAQDSPLLVSRSGYALFLSVVVINQLWWG